MGGEYHAPWAQGPQYTDLGTACARILRGLCGHGGSAAQYLADETGPLTSSWGRGTASPLPPLDTSPALIPSSPMARENIACIYHIYSIDYLSDIVLL